MAMKNNNKHIFRIASFLALTLSVLTSCEKEIEFKGEQVDPKLVINGLMEPGKPAAANISKSLFFLDNEGNTLPPDDVVATLYVNGNPIGVMTPHYDTLGSYDNWDTNSSWMGRVVKVFTHEYCPSIGDVVTVTASANGFDDVEGTTSPLPNEVDVRLNGEIKEWKVWHEDDSLMYIEGKLVLLFDITDPNPGQTDYFKLFINGWKSDYMTENSFSCSFEMDDPVFGASIDNEYVDFSDLGLRPEGVFTDALFDGRSYQLKVNMTIYATVDEEYDPDFFRISMSFEHISKEYYDYLNTCNQGDEVAFQFFSEPVQTYSNVRGGFGLVGGRLVDSLYYDLPINER